MRQTLLNKSLVPPGGYRARCPHCSMWIIAPTYPDMELFVAEHNKANLHLNWDWETQLCESLPSGCRFEDGSISVGHDCRMDTAGLLAGMQAVSSMVFDMALGRDVFVDQTEADRRAAICAGCPKNVNVEGCYSCGSMTAAKALIAKLTGPRVTSFDSQLDGCCVCLCSTKTIAWVRGEYLLKGFTAAQRQVTEQTAAHCWKLTLTAEPEPATPPA